MSAAIPQKVLLFVIIISFQFISFAETDPNYAKADSLYHLGESSLKKSELKPAQKYFKTAYYYISKTDSLTKKVDILNFIGLTYDYLGEYQSALGYYLKALKITNEINYSNGKAVTLNNIGTLYFFWQKYEKSLEYFKRSLAVEIEAGNKTGQADSYVNIAVIYKILGEYKKALNYYKNSMAIYMELGNNKRIAETYNNLGTLYEKQKQFRQTEIYYKKALEIFKTLNDKVGICYTLTNIGVLYSNLNEYNSAIKTIKESLKVSEQTNLTKEKMDAFGHLALIYKKTDNYKSAYKYHILYTQLKDSIFNEEKHNQFIELQTKYETELKERTIDIQKLELQQVQAEQKKDKMIINLTLAILGGFVIVVLLITYLLVQKNKAYKALVKHNIEIVEKENQILKKNINTEIDLKAKEKKYSSSKATDQLKENLLSGIIILMEGKKYYLNAQLTIEELAKELRTNRKYLSQIINEEFSLNFNNYINQYRVKEARRLLTERKYEDYSLQGIALLAGFHTRATFNSSFKKFTGVTPSFFIKSYKKEA